MKKTWATSLRIVRRAPSTFLGCLLLSSALTLHSVGAEIKNGKSYWVARPSGGGFIGSWREHAEDQMRAVRFTVANDGIAVEVTKMDSTGMFAGSAFTLIPEASTPLGKGTARSLGYMSTVNPSGKISKSLAAGLLPAKIPKGLEDDLMKLGADRNTLHRLKAVLESRTALERLRGSGVLDQSPIASADSVLPRKGSKVPGSLSSSPAAGYRRYGPATGDGESDENPLGPDKKEPMPRASGHGGLTEVIVTRDGHVLGGVLSPEEEAEMSHQEAFLDAQERRARGRAQGRTTATGYLIAHDGDFSTITRIDFTADGATETEIGIIPSTEDRDVIDLINTGNKDDEYEAFKRVYYGTRRVFNPDEGRRWGGVGVDPQAWGFLRGTGLASYLWNNWLARTKRDFGITVRQPARGDEGAPFGRVVPQVNRDWVVNPSEGGRPSRTPPSIPDMGDPFPDSNPGGGSRPIPKPKG